MPGGGLDALIRMGDAVGASGPVAGDVVLLDNDLRHRSPAPSAAFIAEAISSSEWDRGSNWAIVYSTAPYPRSARHLQMSSGFHPPKSRLDM